MSHHLVDVVTMSDIANTLVSPMSGMLVVRPVVGLIVGLVVGLVVGVVVGPSIVVVRLVMLIRIPGIRISGIRVGGLIRES